MRHDPGALAVGVEARTRSRHLFLRRGREEFEIAFDSDIAAETACRVLCGIGTAPTREEQADSVQISRPLAEALLAAGLLEPPDTPRPRRAGAVPRLEGLPRFDRLLLVGLDVMGLALLPALASASDVLLVADPWPVHRHDPEDAYREETIGWPRIEGIGPLLHSEHPRVHIVDAGDALDAVIADGTPVVVCMMRFDAALMQRIAECATGPVCILEASGEGLHWRVQAAGGRGLCCALQHRIARDPYGVPSMHGPADWRHLPDPAALLHALDAFPEVLRASSSCDIAMEIDPVGGRIRVAPHPACRICRSPPPPLALPTAADCVPAASRYESLAAFAHPRVGWFDTVIDLPVADAALTRWREFGVDPDGCPVLACHLAVAAASCGGMPGQRLLRGDGIDPQSAHGARARAMLECLERLHGVLHPPHPVRHAVSWLALGDDAPHPEAFRIFSKAQLARPGIAYREPDPDLPIDWVLGTRVLDGRARWLPAGLFGTASDPLWPASSNGLAIHGDACRATLAGTLEAIERDSLLLCWINRIPPPAITDAAGLIDAVPLARGLVRLGIRIRLFDGTTELGVAVLLAVFEDETAPQRFLLNAASGASPEAALERLCLECLQLWRDAFCGEVFSDDGSALQRHHAWHQSTSAAVVEAHAFLATGRGARCATAMPWPELAEPAKALQRIAERLQRAGIELHAVDCTPVSLRSMGLHVIRSVLPGIVPLYAGSDRLPLGVARLKRGSLDGRAACSDDWSPNPHPHPYC